MCTVLIFGFSFEAAFLRFVIIAAGSHRYILAIFAGKCPCPAMSEKVPSTKFPFFNTTVQTSSGDIVSYHEAHLYSLSLGWNVSQIVQNFALFVASLTGEEDVSFLADIESCDQGETEAACRVVTSIRGDCCDTSLQRRFPRLQTSNLQSKFLPGVLLLGSM
jgi:hypothetical protein